MKQLTRYIVVSLLVILMACGMGLTSPKAHAACLPVIVDYPTFGFDMQRTSYNPHECILSTSSTPTPQWIRSYSNQSLASRDGMSVYKDRGYIGLEKDMQALDAFTGTTHWTFPTGDKILGAATIHLDNLYFGSMDKRVYALDPIGGGVLWTNSVGIPIASTPAGFERLVIVSMEDGALYAFERLGGALIWSTPPLGFSVSSPTIFDKKVYVSAVVSVAPLKSVVYALDAWSGATLWSTPGVPAQLTDPVLANKRIYVGADDPLASIYAFDAFSGAFFWQNSTGGDPVYGKPAVDEKQVYVVSASSGKLYALDAFGGGINWASPAPFAQIYKESSPTVANGIVYVGSVNSGSTGWIYGFKTSGAIVFTLQLRGLVDSPVTVVNGWLYATAIDNYVGGFTHSIFAYKG